MVKIHFSCRLADGGLLEIDADPAMAARYQSLAAAGVTGKSLIDQAISDDWSAPPTFVVVTMTPESGKSATISIPYR